MASTALKRQFVWTGIPAGRVVTQGGERLARLTVLLTPRLLGPAAPPLTLASFGMQRWPERLAGMSFDVTFGATVVAARRVPFVTAAGTQVSFSTQSQQSAWDDLFGAGALVRPYAPGGYKDRPRRTFPAADAAAVVRQAYGGAARMHLDHDGDSPERNDGLRTALQDLRATWSASAPALAQGYDFYRREDHADFTPLTPFPTDRADEREFHEVATRLADHPLLLRALGLAVDLAVPAASIPSGNLLRIAPHPPPGNPPPGWTAAAQEDICPQTLFELSGTRFVPRGTGRIRSGMVALGGAGVAPSANPGWEVLSFDVDGAVVRMVGTSGAAPGDEALPALRSMGFTLVQRDREQAHAERLGRAQLHGTPALLQTATLNADDLLGGYRIDVLDVDTGKWRSLSMRRVSYGIGTLSIGHELEEAWVRPLAATTGAGDRDALYLHEAVARWDGWSVAVQRPERAVQAGAMLERAGVDAPFEAAVAPEPGSLPRLRFGRQYRLRARVADLAGGGLELDEPTHEESRTEVFTHRRYEPVPPPEVLPTHRLEDGETDTRLVIRSDRGVSVAAFAGAHAYRPFDLRQVLAPKAPLDLAMQHRLTFDSAMGPEAPREEIERMFKVAQRADRDLLDIPGAQTVGFEQDEQAPRPYVILPADGVQLPWLADPMSKAVALRQAARPLDQGTGLPGASTGLPQKCLWRGDWHSREPVKLRLVAAESGCTVTQSADRRLLEVALGPAEEVTLDVSSCPLAEDVDLFGIAAWLGVTKDKTELIASGGHRMITPPRTLTLVHAVKRPRRDPGGTLAPQRQSEETSCRLDTTHLDVDTASTVRIDIDATWSTFEDRPGSPPRTRQQRAHVASFDVDRGPLRLPELRQELGDTKRRKVSYSVTAISRFADCFTKATGGDPAEFRAFGSVPAVDIPSSARPPAPKVIYTVPTFRWETHVESETAQTRIRRGGGLRIYLERPWFESGEGELLAVLVSRGVSQPGEAIRPFVSVNGDDLTSSAGIVTPPTIIRPADLIAPVSAPETLPEASWPIQAVGHEVHYDDERDLWYADVDLSKLMGPMYFLFVQLAVARYQPNSVLPLDRLSPATQTEPIQLPPHRTLRVTRSPERLTATVDGVAPSSNRVVARLQLLSDDAPDPGDAIADWVTLNTVTGQIGQALQLDTPLAGGRPVRLLVEELDGTAPGVGPQGETLSEPGRLVYADTVDLPDLGSYG